MQVAVLNVSATLIRPMPHHRSQVLLTYKGQELGVMQVESKWAPNKVRASDCSMYQLRG